MSLNPLNRSCNACTNVQWQSTPKQTFYITKVGPKSGFLLWYSNYLPVVLLLDSSEYTICIVSIQITS